MTAVAAALPKIQNEVWILRCTNEEQRDEALAYAASKGVPCWELNRFASNTELDLGWAGDLMAYGTIASTAMRKVSAAEFRAMCDAYVPE